MKKNNKGFSLVELIIVIAIMAILAGAIAPALIRYIDKSRKSNDVSSCDTIETAINTALGNESVSEFLCTYQVGGMWIELTPAEKYGTAGWPTGASTDGAAVTISSATNNGSAANAWKSSSGKSSDECMTVLYNELSDSFTGKNPKIKYKKDADSKKKADLSFYVYVNAQGNVEVYIGAEGITLANMVTVSSTTAPDGTTIYDPTSKVLDGDTADTGKNVYEICPEVCDNYQ